jgi:hypothetical protein
VDKVLEGLSFRAKGKKKVNGVEQQGGAGRCG